MSLLFDDQLYKFFLVFFPVIDVAQCIFNYLYNDKEIALLYNKNQNQKNNFKLCYNSV
jgi:hypothetical protein